MNNDAGLTKDIRGQDNQIVEDEAIRYIGSSIRITGHRNRIVIGSGAVLNNLKIAIDSDDNEIIIGSRARLTGNIAMKLAPGNRVAIGAGTSVGGANFICGESTEILIGEDCMFSWGVEIRSTDSHAIFDMDTDERINKASNIELGNHVWVGAHATLLGGARVGSGSIVGIRSVVSKAFQQENVVIVGVPARVTRERVRWERPLLG